MNELEKLIAEADNLRREYLLEHFARATGAADPSADANIQRLREIGAQGRLPYSTDTSAGQLATARDTALHLANWMEACRKAAEEREMQGMYIPGYRLVPDTLPLSVEKAMGKTMIDCISSVDGEYTTWAEVWKMLIAEFDKLASPTPKAEA